MMFRCFLFKNETYNTSGIQYKSPVTHNFTATNLMVEYEEH